MVNKEQLLDNKYKFDKKLIYIPYFNCILFEGYHNKDGYAEFQFRDKGVKKNILAHRASFIYNNNLNIDVNDVIMHTCDNPNCVNPKHLIKGTHETNVADRVSKGRSAKGKNNGRYF